jgi:propanediol utilization protein
MTKKKAAYTIDGEPASLRGVKRKVKSDHISQTEAISLGLSAHLLESGRIDGKVRTTCYYSKQDVMNLTKASKNKR